MLGLSDKDKDWLYLAMEEVAKKNNDILLNKVKKLLQSELKEALTAFLVREITTERGPRGNGDLEKTIEKEEVNVLEFLCRYLPLVEGAIRGCQQDSNKSLNRTLEMKDGLAAIAGILISNENTMRQIANVKPILNTEVYRCLE